MPLKENSNEFERLKKINWALENTPAHWWKNISLLSYWGNSYIIITSEVERFTIKVAHLVNEKITDQPLKEHWKQFIREESAHAYVHFKVSNDLQRHKYPVTFITNCSKYFFKLASKMNIKSQMALVLSMEFVAHELSILALKGNFFPRNVLAIYDFLQWHAQEELTHINLCFQIYQCLESKYIRRVIMMIFFTLFIFISFLSHMIFFVFVDLAQGRGMKFKNFTLTYRFLCQHKRLIWTAIKHYFSFFYRRFNPSTMN